MLERAVMIKPEPPILGRVLFECLASPYVLLPFAGGITGLLAIWTFNIHSGLAVTASLAGIFGAVGIFATRFLLTGKAITRRLLEKMTASEAKKREAALDDLDQRLQGDGDPRNEGYLRDLRALLASFAEIQPAGARVDSSLTLDIAKIIRQLFDHCIECLEHSLKLSQTAHKLNEESARKPLLAEREKVFKEIETCLRDLGKVRAEFRGAAAGDSPVQKLTDVRQELDQSLAVARRVEERMREFDSEANKSRKESQ
jgi:hypothetical protein